MAKLTHRNFYYTKKELSMQQTTPKKLFFFCYITFFAHPGFECHPQTLPLQPARLRHPHGTQEILLNAASFPT